MKYDIYKFKRKTKYRFYVRFIDDHGTQRDLSTGVCLPLKHTNQQLKQAKEQARKKAKVKVLQAMGLEKPEVREQLQTLRDYLRTVYYPYLNANRAKTTLESYRNALSHFLDICGNKPMEAYNKSHLNEYKNHRYSKDGIKKTTINIELRSIKAAFNWAFKHDYMTRFSFKGQHYMFDVPSTRREFKKYELDKLFERAEGTTAGLAIKLAYYTGMRIGELTNIQWRMINMDKHTLHLPGKITKSGKPRGIPLNRKAFEIIMTLEELLKEKRKKNPKWFKNIPFEECYLLQKQRGIGQYKKRSIQDMLRKMLNELGLPKELSFHSLRHSFATHALENGQDIYGVSKVMGHSTVQVTSDFYDHTSAVRYRSVVDSLC